MNETTKKEIEVRALGCELTEAERLERGGALASVVMSVANYHLELSERKAEFKAEKDVIEQAISALRVRQSDLSKSISEGVEERDVKCEAVFDYEAGTVTVRRLDNDQVIEDREMKGLEKQMQLDYDEDNPPETSATVDCHACDGIGSTQDGDDDPKPCSECDGSGQIIVSVTAEGSDDE